MEDHVPQIVELDVRPQLRQKLEPFPIIMEAVNKLHEGDTFVLHATFKPTPLLGLMKTKGFDHSVTHDGGDNWTVTFTRDLNGNPQETVVKAAINPEDEPDDGTHTYELDNRGLEPPQPMVRTLAKLEKAKVGDQVIIHNDRVPMFLIDELNTLGYKYHIEEQADGSALVHIRKT